MELLINATTLSNYKSRDMLPLKCKQCSQTFTRPKHEIQKVLNGKQAVTLDFCCRKCSNLAKIRKIIVSCAQCGKTISRLSSQIKKTKNKLSFCNRSCAAIYNNEHRKFLKSNKVTYRPNALKHFPHVCNICGYNKYLAVLQIHHKDKNRRNNTLNNLEILCPTCHEERHFIEKTGRYRHSI